MTAPVPARAHTELLKLKQLAEYVERQWPQFLTRDEAMLIGKTLRQAASVERAGEAVAWGRLEAFANDARPYGYVRDNEVIATFLKGARAALASPPRSEGDPS